MQLQGSCLRNSCLDVSQQPSLIFSNRAQWKRLFRAQSHMQRGSNSKSFVPGEAVWVRMYGTTHRWKATTVTRILGPKMFVVTTEDGLSTRRPTD
ncbi:hypothetical protein FKM82_026571 [Ascaphus truei]